MTEKMLEMIRQSYPLTEKQADPELLTAKVAGFNFKLKAYDAAGLGNVSVMTGTMPLGLMKMDSLVINPFDRDAPLMSYDRIYAMGNDTLLAELYDTRIDKAPFDDLLDMIKEYDDIPTGEFDPGWYDDILLPQSIKKKGKKKQTARIDELTGRYLESYLNFCKAAPECDRAAKLAEASAYTEGLLKNGGPSTDNFIKTKGIEFTQRMFREVFFGTGDPQ